MFGKKTLRASLLSGAASTVILFGAGAANAQQADFDISPQPLSAALTAFSEQSQVAVIFSPELTATKTTRGVAGSNDAQLALNELLAGTGLSWRRDGSAFVIVRADSPQGGSAAGGGATVEALIVTAQKREEDIQDVPIAISAFSQEDLTRSQIAGGPDLITQVPNFTFTKTNFSSYSIQIRGIGTQAISATTDPAVAVAFNNTPFIRNRFFEQEFYDLQRVEVLRGPQGTLYGRNATAGVVNIISAKPKFYPEAKVSADVGNYSSTRIEAMANIPLVEDTVVLRIAGAWTKRDGFALNEITGSPIDGRDLWSTRVSLRFTPSDRIDANLIWEHFEEDDDRLRSGKQLCHKDVVTEVAGFPTHTFQNLLEYGQVASWSGVQPSFSQGCKRGSLYSPDAFQTPNGEMLPYYVSLAALGLPVALPEPYVSTVQSRDLRTIESTVDPGYRAKSDLGELQISFDLTDNLTLTSETGYARDWVFSTQDFNRFNTQSGAWEASQTDLDRGVFTINDDGYAEFCDPQIGCADRLVATDLSTAEAWQFSQELRLGSDFDGPFNFSLGANFLRADSEDKYYVFINSLSLRAAIAGYQSVANPPPYVAGETDNTNCLVNGPVHGDPDNAYAVSRCIYMDPNSLGSLNDAGHNYFLSKNPYSLISYAVFGEAYYNVTDNLKVTAGLRWTVDKKDAPRIPSWLLASETAGYPVAEIVSQEWREPTGRLTVDWKPDLSFTDETLLYASYAHGYKAGGANPPGFVRVYYSDSETADASAALSATRPKTFDPEFVDAFELGSKNTFAEGRVTLNLAAFYYDYEGYQVSEIVDRSAFNRNFDAEVWGAEIEADWRPLENLRLSFKGGYEKTRIADGEEAIDLMDRTAGDPRWTLHRPFPTYASSCILPTWLFVGNNPGTYGGQANTPFNPELVNLGGVGGGNAGGCELAYLQGMDPVNSNSLIVTHNGVINYTNWSTDPNDYPGLEWPDGIVTDRTYPGWDPSTAPNNGEGINKPLGGNELPNAPHWTFTLSGDYTLPLAGDWLVDLHTDLHWQGQSYWRVFQDSDFSTLDEYFTMNLAAIFTNEDAGWTVMAYVKNVTDETAITGAFLNSDDTGLTTNVFLTEPRLYGIRVTKAWADAPLLGGLAARHDGPYPWTVELGGQVQRWDAPNTTLDPSFANEFMAPLNILDRPQNEDLHWGDGRSVKVTYRPANSPWSLGVAARFGETKGNNRVYAENPSDLIACAFTGTIFEAFCTLPDAGPFLNISRINWADAQSSDREEYKIGDLTVSRDAPLAGLSRSVLSGALRYAELESATLAAFRGNPDWNIPEGVGFPPPNGQPSTHTEYQGEFRADRSFEGIGPVISWDAAYPVFAFGNGGSVDISWSLSAGVLFGDQDVNIAGSEQATLFQTNFFTVIGLSAEYPIPIPQETPEPLDIQRSKSVTAPMAGGSLGLSYQVDRFSLGAGYRWERYFDAIDGGVTEPSKKDRTIDGPYLKVSVGFGG